MQNKTNYERNYSEEYIPGLSNYANSEQFCMKHTVALRSEFPT